MPEMLNNIRVVLSHTTHPGNIGAAARAMKTMGLQHLYLLNPKQFPDRQADAMAASADDVLKNAVVCRSLDEALHGAVLVAGMSARVRDISQEIFPPRAAMPMLMEQAAHNPVALLFGTEMSGLTNDEMARCQFMICIPANPEYASLNLAAAVQVMSYEIALAVGQGEIQLGRQAVPEIIPAPAEQVEMFFKHLEETLDEIGFLQNKQSNKLMYKLRRLYARARLEQEEVNILRGILRLTSEYRGQHFRELKLQNKLKSGQ